jgi:hypothetical protein
MKENGFCKVKESENLAFQRFAFKMDQLVPLRRGRGAGARLRDTSA